MCKSKAPKPDPLIGQAAKENAAIAKEQLALAKQQLAWEQNRAEEQDPQIKAIVDQQIKSGDDNSARAAEQWQIYQDLFKPVEEKMVNEAMDYDSPERKERMAAEAGADVSRGYQASQDQNTRTMGAMGINPNSGRAAAMANENSIGLAKDSAGAMNAARRATEQQGIALRTGAAQFGRGMSATGIAADSLALNAGTAATGSMAAGSQIRNANMAAAQNWFGGAASANNSAGGLMNNLYQSQVAAQQAAASQSSGAMSGLGMLGGAAMSAAPEIAALAM